MAAKKAALSICCSLRLYCQAGRKGFSLIPFLAVNTSAQLQSGGRHESDVIFSLCLKVNSGDREAPLGIVVNKELKNDDG